MSFEMRRTHKASATGTRSGGAVTSTADSCGWYHVGWRCCHVGRRCRWPPQASGHVGQPTGSLFWSLHLVFRSICHDRFSIRLISLSAFAVIALFSDYVTGLPEKLLARHGSRRHRQQLLGDRCHVWTGCFVFHQDIVGDLWAFAVMVHQPQLLNMSP